MKKRFKFAAAMALGLAFVGTLASCGEDASTTTTNAAETTGEKNPSPATPSKKPDEKTIKYDASVIAESGKPLRDFEIMINDENGKYINSIFTGNDGKAVIELAPGKYNLEVLDRDGYILEKNTASVSKENVSAKFQARTYLPKATAPKGTTYTEGEAAYDFTATLSDGTKWNLYDTLYGDDSTYRCAVINLWYVNCAWCAREFPIIQEVLDTVITDSEGNAIQKDGKDVKYKDYVSFVALDVFQEDVAGYKANNNYKFDMGYDDADLKTAFGASGCPTTAVVDKYGAYSFIHEGALTEAKDWIQLFDKFIVDNYVQVFEGAIDEDLRPTVETPDSSELVKAACGKNYDGTDFTTTFYKNKETDTDRDKEFSWPFVPSKDGNAIVNSNKDKNNTFAMTYFNVKLKEGEVLAFDFYSSTERDYDILYVAVDDVLVTNISGESPALETCYAFVPLYEKEYQICLLYVKDKSSSKGDDTVTISNIHIDLEENISHPTTIFREAASGDFDELMHRWTHYVDVVMGEDGYYHVGTATGPILMADLLSSTHFANDDILTLAYEPGIKYQGEDLKDEIVKYAALAGNAKLPYVPVDEELHDLLVKISKSLGTIESSKNEKQWLEMCVYYSAYGMDEVESPIKGLTTNDPIYFIVDDELHGHASAEFTTTVIPRGFYFKLTPTVTGVYKFYSEGTEETEAWWFSSINGADQKGVNGEDLRDYIIQVNESSGDPDGNFIRYQYLEAGRTYYLTAAFYDPTYYGEINVKYEWVSDSSTLLTSASPSVFVSADAETSDENEFVDIGELGSANLDAIKSGNYIQVELGEDGYYHVVGKTEGDSFVYCEVVYATGIFDSPLMNDEYIVDGVIHDFVHLKGFDFTNSIDEAGNKIEGGTMTEAAVEYITNNLITEGDAKGCVRVNAEFVEILKKIMAKYAFNVDDSWLKLCYYFVTLD